MRNRRHTKPPDNGGGLLQNYHIGTDPLYLRTQTHIYFISTPLPRDSVAVYVKHIQIRAAWESGLCYKLRF